MRDFDKITFFKYPRTPHLEGSTLQSGDESLNQIKFDEIKNIKIAVSEKIDGANVAISFSSDGDMLLQSRGHYLRGGAKEKDYELFKAWAHSHYDELYNVLSSKYILFGEWMYIKHKIYYDDLPSYFIALDIYDTDEDCFFSTIKMHAFMHAYELDKFIPMVNVLAIDKFASLDALLKLLDKSHYQSNEFKIHLNEDIIKSKLDINKTMNETDLSGLMEGLYIKVEDDEKVLKRMKYVRHNYIQINDNDENWFNKKKMNNRLKGGLRFL